MFHGTLPLGFSQAWGPHIDLRDSHLLALAAAERQFLQSEYEDYAVANTSSIACLRSIALIVRITLWISVCFFLTFICSMG